MDYNILLLLSSAKGVQGVSNELITKWIGPAFLLLVAALSIKFVVQRQFRELAGFLVISAVVAVLIFAGDYIFGSGGVFTKLGKDAAGLVGNHVNLFRLLQ